MYVVRSYTTRRSTRFLNISIRFNQPNLKQSQKKRNVQQRCTRKAHANEIKRTRATKK